MIHPEIIKIQLEKIKNTPIAKKLASTTKEVFDRLNGDKNLFTGKISKYGRYGEYSINAGSGAIELLNSSVGLFGKIDDVTNLAKNIQKVSKTYTRPTKITEDVAHLLKEYGLSKADTYRLMEDGWDVRQIFEAFDRRGVKSAKTIYSNNKAKLLTQEMLDVGMSPNNKSKYEYLKELSKKGEKIYKDKWGNPMTEKEFKRRYPDDPLVEVSVEYLDSHYKL